MLNLKLYYLKKNKNFHSNAIKLEENHVRKYFKYINTNNKKIQC
jgi:hypothetical protein